MPKRVHFETDDRQAVKVQKILSSSEEESNSEDEVDPGPMTQAMCEDIVNEVERPKTPALPEDVNELNEKSLMTNLELIWTPYLLGLIHKLLVNCQVTSTHQYDLVSKKFYTNLIPMWVQALPKIITKRKHLLNKCSWMDFCDRLRVVKLFTTFTQLEMSEETIIIWRKSFEVLSKQRSLSLLNTTTTSMSSTTARGTPTVVDVPVSKTSKEAENAIDELFGAMTTPQITGVIQQHISKLQNGKLSTWRSPGETGLTVVKLETYSFDKIVGLDKKLWWKEAEYRTLYTISSIADPKHMMTQKLIHQVALDLKNITGVQNETKEMGSATGFFNFPRRQYTYKVKKLYKMY